MLEKERGPKLLNLLRKSKTSKPGSKISGLAIR